MNLIDWLVGLGKREVYAVKVTIPNAKFRALNRLWKPEVYVGARYLEVRHYREGERQVTDGGKKVGDEYLEEWFYLLGPVPKTNQPRNRRGFCKICYQIEGRTDGSFDWYVACHSSTANPNEHQPFGAFFMLHRWPSEFPWMGAIDQYEETKNVRCPISVETIDPALLPSGHLQETA
jgi:hypothetical protein